MIDKSNVGGTIFKKIESTLSKYDFYNDFRSGTISRDQYLSKLMAKYPVPLESMLNEDQAHLSSRFPLDEEKAVDKVLLELKQAGVIGSTVYDKNAFSQLRDRVYSLYYHANKFTYIFPEEERIVSALVDIVKPKNVLVLGSYYGYWAIWAAATKVAPKIHLVDIDVNSNRVSQVNFDRLIRGDFSINTVDGVDFFKSCTEKYDFILLDAEGPEFHSDPDMIGKYVYYPIMKAAHRYIADGGMIVCHNMLFKNLANDPYFDKKIEENRLVYNRFLTFLREKNYSANSFSTTEGIGIYKKP